MIAYSLKRSPPIYSDDLKLGFSVWARSRPKDYLTIYPKIAKEIQNETMSSSFSLCALVDDIWPKTILSRTCGEQQDISSSYITLLPKFGFHEVHLVSEFVKENALEVCLSYATKITISEFWKLLPRSKKEDIENLTLVEMFGFLWHIHVLEIAINKFQITGLLAGIRSEFFYLTARKLLPPHDVYFINTL